MRAAVVGIVMPVRNGARTVARAIDSVVAQTYPHWRLYVVDDGSTDETPAILARYAAREPRLTVVHNATPAGVAHARNLGWRATVEPLIACADADDVCLPERFARQIAYFHEHPETDVLGTGIELVNEDGRHVGVHQRPTDHAELLARLPRQTPFMQPSVMMRRTFLERMHGYREGRGTEDFDLWLRGAPSSRYANLHEVLVRYTVSPGGLTMSWTYMRSGALAALGYCWRRREWVAGVFYAARYLLGAMLMLTGLRQRRI